MDQFTAHLDRGWDLAQRGDAAGAEDSARQAMALEGDSPEAHNLMGYSMALRGQAEEALELYQQAIALDDTFLEAVVNAAEVCLHPLGDPEAALNFLNSALELVETPEEQIEVQLLRFDAHMAMGNDDKAQEVGELLPPPPYQNASHYFLIGRVLFESGSSLLAEPLLLEAARLEHENAEVFYYLGMLRDEQGDVQAATSYFLRTRERDLKQEPPPWSCERDDFERSVTLALERLAPTLRGLVNPQEIYVNDLPGMEVIVEGADPRAMVILDSLEGSTSLLRVFVYQRNVERMAPNFESLEDALVACLEQEVANFAFGEHEAPSAESGTLN
jgi:tetratricopeptide (TPR) repeat protein